ncbi:hypothetical protein NE237_001873 [Protea cynaroides]|uniref:Uncharacterized protein n=1 Tax=Protea cynaroides TaxID=273540 RepID=A0A9Q0QYT4_9MAGN|nr:hypothetical protein NE237_001873 [Protea cynaroides]
MTLQGDNLVVSEQKLERMLCMKGRKGETCYANNSKAQAKHVRSMLHLLESTLDRVQLQPPETPFAVADLGCSCGGNTIYIIEVIIKHISKRYEANGYDTPEFFAFFSDLPSNDFNTLFQLLPPLAINRTSMEECLVADGHRSYFSAGVPGSFYRRLFLARSIDVFYSAFSLHWLSQVPKILMDKRSTAYNKGRVFIYGAGENTVNAYKNQFQALSSVPEVTRETMWILSDQGGASLLFRTYFQDAWDDLVQEGLVESEKRDSFNIPLYAPSLQDFKEVVEADGSFAFNKLEVFRGGSPLVVNQPDDEAEVGRAFANSCRSVCGVLVDAHIGDQLSEELFKRLEPRATAHAKEFLEQLQFFHIVASLSFA